MQLCSPNVFTRETLSFLHHVGSSWWCHRPAPKAINVRVEIEKIRLEERLFYTAVDLGIDSTFSASQSYCEQLLSILQHTPIEESVYLPAGLLPHRGF